MDNATAGVIYFSLGSLLQPAHLQNVGLKFSRIFRELPYKIIWKWKPELLDNIPENVMVREWLPQIDILNHRNCILFISHGGYHSLIETIHAGLPILAVPFFNDQYYNTAIIEKLLIGKKISLESSENELTHLIEELIVNKMYSRNAERQSVIFRDRPQTPLDTAVYWTEYVLRHKGAPHLRSVATNLYWYEYILLDVICFFILVILSIYYIVKFCFSKLYVKLSLIVKRKMKFE